MVSFRRFGVASTRIETLISKIVHDNDNTKDVKINFSRQHKGCQDIMSSKLSHDGHLPLVAVVVSVVKRKFLFPS